MPQKKLEELNQLYSRAEEIDRELFAEQRSNVLLIAGEHYSKLSNKIASQIRSSNRTPTTQEQKLRLTKNHLHKVHRSYCAAILSEAPDTTIAPQHDTEIQDQKDAEMNLAVWQDIKRRHNFKRKRAAWCDQFVGIGEVCTKIFWDNMAGTLVGYEPQVDEAGNPVIEVNPETGQPEQALDETRPIFSGDYVFEDVYGFNLLREDGTERMEDEHRAWIIRKMTDTEALKDRYKDEPEKAQKIQTGGATESYIVFDVNRGSYQRSENQTLVREYYWKPSSMYPMGYFVISTKDVILEEGPLPEGIFPLVWAGFDEYPTSPRGRSILKVARPYQAEINRASSQMALAQVTLGDDKILYQAGTKLAPGALLPGVRGVSYQGAAPQVLPGRSGAQYLEYVGAQIAEMYSVLMLDENATEDKGGQVDPYALLFKAASKKRRFSAYVEKFERFMVDVTELCLRIGRIWMPDDMVIPAVGARDIVNMPEFRDTSPLAYSIKIEPRADTLETQLGKQLTFQHVLQYVGKDLDQKTIGKLIKNAPFANFEDSFEELTIDEDIAKNDMLALERGEPVQPAPYVEPTYMVKKLTHRMKKPDFRFLPDEVKMNYDALKQAYLQIEAENQAKILAAKNEYIPVDGALVTVDVYVPDPKNPQNQAKRAKVPQRAVEWLMKRLEEQGASMDQLESMNAQNLAGMAEMLMAQGGPSPQAG